MTAEDWQGVLGDILDTVAPGDDTFDLALLTAKDRNGVALKDLLPQESLSAEGDDLDGWWTDVQAPQSAAWTRRRWSELRAHPATMTVAFFRFYAER